ncbi:MAG TPA: extracellular solute-binding protein [Gaiellaceae bacterium]|nr:extracellular solute-binding protein [Gaiellaceae bacterium]
MADTPQDVERTTRREVLRRAGVGGLLIVYGGALPKTSAAGVPKYRHKELAGTLRIIQWSHFVPAYDKWFDDIYVKRWGQANDTEVVVDHINQADIPARAAAEVAAQRGHDLFFFLSPPAAYEDQVLDHSDIVQEVTKKRGKMKNVAFKATYNPKTKKYFAFSDNYVPDPVNYRTDLWGEAGFRPTSWDNVLKAAPKLRAMGHPIGIGMSNEIDSNMALMAMMMCFGSFIQNKEQRVVLNSKGTVEALKFARELYRQGMSNEIFAWTASSNNQAMVAGRLSMAMNAISITRTAEGTNPDLAAKISLLPIPSGPNGRLGLEHVMGAYVIWKFASNKAAAKKFLVDLETKYIGAFENSKFYNFPSWPASVPNIDRRVARDPVAKPPGKYKVLAEIAEKYTLNPGWPGNTNAAIDEIFNKFLIPQMFAEVAQGKRTPEEAARVYDRSFRGIFQRWRNRGKI